MEPVKVNLNTAVIVAALVCLLLFSLGTVYGQSREPKLYMVTPADPIVTTPSTTAPVIAEVDEP